MENVLVSASSLTRVEWHGEHVDLATSSVDVTQQGHSLFPSDVGDIVDGPLKLRLQISHGELKSSADSRRGCRPAFPVAARKRQAADLAGGQKRRR